MDFYLLILISVALGLDAFAVSFAGGAYYGKTSARQKFRLSFHFGLFQFFMPILGWAAGITMVQIIDKYDHWIAFLVLMIIGIKMIIDSFEGQNQRIASDISKGWFLVMLSIATSIDALAVGFSMGLVNIKIIIPSIIIGLVAASMSLTGIKLGEIMSFRISNRISIIGGTILILIGIHIVADHMEWI
jgi:manganese efflux pump family protein